MGIDRPRRSRSPGTAPSCWPPATGAWRIDKSAGTATRRARLPELYAATLSDHPDAWWWAPAHQLRTFTRRQGAGSRRSQSCRSCRRPTGARLASSRRRRPRIRRSSPPATAPVRCTGGSSTSGGQAVDLRHRPTRRCGPRRRQPLCCRTTRTPTHAEGSVCGADQVSLGS